MGQETERSRKETRVSDLNVVQQSRQATQTSERPSEGRGAALKSSRVIPVAAPAIWEEKSFTGTEKTKGLDQSTQQGEYSLIQDDQRRAAEQPYERVNGSFGNVLTLPRQSAESDVTKAAVKELLPRKSAIMTLARDDSELVSLESIAVSGSRQQTRQLHL